MKTTAARLGVRLILAGTAVGVAFGLSGCLQSNTALPGAGPSSTSSSASSSTPKASAPTPSPTASAQKFAEDCGILFTPAQVYSYNPNFVADTAYKPKPGTIPSAIAAQSGQTCGWLNESSGSLIEVAIATPTPARLAAAKAAASTGTPIDSNGEHGFFAVTNGVGSAQFFFGSIWLDVSSGDFTTVADAQTVYPIIVENQLHAGG